jgi:hypothetical protein
MKKEIIQKLNEINFGEVVASLEALKAFQQEHGHCRVAG